MRQGCTLDMKKTRKKNKSTFETAWNINTKEFDTAESQDIRVMRLSRSEQWSALGEFCTP